MARGEEERRDEGAGGTCFESLHESDIGVEEKRAEEKRTEQRAAVRVRRLMNLRSIRMSRCSAQMQQMEVKSALESSRRTQLHEHNSALSTRSYRIAPEQWNACTLNFNAIELSS